MAERAMQDPMKVTDRAGGERAPFVAAGPQQFGVKLTEVNGPKLWMRIGPRCGVT